MPKFPGLVQVLWSSIERPRGLIQSAKCHPSLLTRAWFNYFDNPIRMASVSKTNFFHAEPSLGLLHLTNVLYSAGKRAEVLMPVENLLFHQAGHVYIGRIFSNEVPLVVCISHKTGHSHVIISCHLLQVLIVAILKHPVKNHAFSTHSSS